MKELIPYIFEHPQYGMLRVVVEEDRIYYDLFDVKTIFLKGHSSSIRLLPTQKEN